MKTGRIVKTSSDDFLRSQFATLEKNITIVNLLLKLILLLG